MSRKAPGSGRYLVLRWDRAADLDRLVCRAPTLEEADYIVRQKNGELLSRGADPWKCDLYYVMAGDPHAPYLAHKPQKARRKA